MTDEEDLPPDPLSAVERDDAAIIMRNMEKSRQVAHYRPLYILAVIVAIGVALLAMFVDYQIIRGDVWTRALSNEFMVVPASLQSSVAFKSLQVIFAVLIVHFFLKITGVYGRNAMITAGFVFALVMIGCLGYLVAYNNMAGGTSVTLEQAASTPRRASRNNSIDALFTTSKPAPATPAATPAASDGFSLGLPKLSSSSLAAADSWFWLAFASVIFFIVTTVAALYMLTVENNVRNLHIARDYKHRQRQFAQLHLLQLADKRDLRMKLFLAATTVFGLIGGGAVAVQAARHGALVEASLNEEAALAPRRVVIGIDISKSNPLVDDQAFAAKVAARIANIVRRLGMASEVHVRTFGSYDASSNNFYYDALISARNRPEVVAAEIHKLIAGTPQLVRSGKWRSQENTNILAFLDNVSQSIGCGGLPTTVVLASDGIEDSDYVRLQNSGAHLPAPDGRPFRGCSEMQILGIGQGTRSPSSPPACAANGPAGPPPPASPISSA